MGAGGKKLSALTAGGGREKVSFSFGRNKGFERRSVGWVVKVICEILMLRWYEVGEGRGEGGGDKEGMIWNIPVSIDVAGSLVPKSKLVGRSYCGRGMALTRDRVAMIENR